VTTLTLVRIDEDIEDDAWQLLESHDDTPWSYVDAWMSRSGETKERADIPIDTIGYGKLAQTPVRRRRRPAKRVFSTRPT
jgi:hypothetical protein